MALRLLELGEIAGAERHGVDRAGLQRGQARAAKTDGNIGDGVGIDAMLAQQQADREFLGVAAAGDADLFADRDLSEF